MPVYCEPWPGKSTASLPGAPARTPWCTPGGSGRRRRRGAPARGRASQLQVGDILATIATVSRSRAPARGAGLRRDRAARRPDGGRARRRTPASRATSAAPIGRAPEQQLGGPALARPRCAGFRRNSPRYSSSTTWKLVPPKPKALTAARRGASSGLEPRHRLVDQVERAGRLPRGRVRLVDAAVRRQHPVVQRERRLDQPGDAGRGLGVADHRLDRADRRLARRDAGLRRSARVVLSSSAVSPATVPVPCASNRPTVAGPKPACA